MQAGFTKLHDFTVLKLTWEGNFRKRNCNNCCARWWLTIDGSVCTSYEEIVTSIASSSAYDIFAPTTLTGVCVESGDTPLWSGNITISLHVGNCEGSQVSNTATGFFSTSRFIIEEIPLRESSLDYTDHFINSQCTIVVPAALDPEVDQLRESLS